MIKLKEIMDQFELHKVYSNPYHTAFKSLNESVEKKLYIMVGLPGSGKSTFIQSLDKIGRAHV